MNANASPGGPAEELPALLRTREFWLFYSDLGDGCVLDEALIRRYAPPGGGGEESGTVVFAFGCPPEHRIELQVELAGSSFNLGLSNARQGIHGELGWWDGFRWHPFALRWMELEYLIHYWQEHPEDCPWGTAAALLLLSPFVGNGCDELEALPLRRQEIAAAYAGLGLFSTEEIPKLAENALRSPTENDYRWTRDSGLGWVFSGDYPCYSIRNPEHAGGREGSFPFVEFGRVITALNLEA